MLTKKRVLTTAAVSFLGLSVLGGIACQQSVTNSYDNLLEKINNVEGLSAKKGSLQLGVFDTKATTVLAIEQENFKMLSAKLPGIFDEKLLNKKRVFLQIEHDIKNFSYPIEVSHSLTLTDKVSLDKGRYEDLVAITQELPLQVMSLHSFTGSFNLLGMSDHIKYGDLMEITPVRFNLTSNSDASNVLIQGSTPLLQSNNKNDRSTTKFEDINISWEGSLDDCFICEGSQGVSVGSIRQLSPNGDVTMLVNNIDVSMGTYLQDNKYSFSFDLLADELAFDDFKWDNLVLNTNIKNVSEPAVLALSENFNKSIQAGPEMGLNSAQTQKMFARLLEAGMTINIDTMSADTPSGKFYTSLKLELPEGRMPNIELNPMGLIPVIKGRLISNIPAAELDKIFGVGASASVAQSGMVSVSNDGKMLKTIISVEEGDARVNGKRISL